MGSGSRNSCTRSASTTTNPSGFSRSLAILARNLFGATPTEATSPRRSRISHLIVRPILTAGPNSGSLPVTSRNASSSDRGSTKGVYFSKIARI